LGKTFRHNGKASDPEVLLQFLSENSAQPKLSKGPNERLFEILNRNLHSPQKAADWDHLVANNRKVQIVCNREYIWAMATTSVRLSESMYNCWVTSADEIQKAASNHSFRVSATSTANRITHRHHNLYLDRYSQPLQPTC